MCGRYMEEDRCSVLFILYHWVDVWIVNEKGRNVFE